MKILVIGDLSVDFFVIGECPRISPEKPVVVFCPLETNSNPGMAGNVEANLRSLAPDVEIRTLYPDKPSIKTRYVDKGSNQHLLRVDEDVKSEPLSAAKFIDVLDKDILNPYSAVVLSSYAKGFLTVENMEAILLLCENRDIPTFVDLKEILGDWSKSATVVKINSKEYTAQLIAGVKEPWTKCKNLIVTQGARGMVLLDQEGREKYRTKTRQIDVKDFVGAGDSVNAGLVIGYLESNDLFKAMNFASKVGDIAVSKPGVVAVKREEVI